MHAGIHVRCLIFLGLLNKINESTNISKNSKYEISRKPLNRVAMFYADGRTDRRMSRSLQTLFATVANGTGGNAVHTFDSQQGPGDSLLFRW